MGTQDGNEHVVVALSDSAAANLQHVDADGDMGGQGQLGIAHTDPDPDCSSSHTSRHEASGDENAPAVDTNTSHDASVFVSGPPDAKDSHGDAGFGGGMKKTPSAPLRPNKPPLAPSKTPRSQSARKGVMSGSKWGSADATKALQSLSSCQGSVSLNLGHEGLFSSALFTADDWKEHTSFKRWLPEPLYLFKVVKGLLVPLAWVLTSCTACAIYEEVIRKEQPSWGSLHNLNANFAYSLCSFALSLLLIFKTNSSYGRFWEARSAWGGLHSDCRSFILKMQAHATADCPLKLRKALMRWTITLPYIIRAHLLEYGPGTDALAELLTKDEVEWLRRPVDGLRGHQPMRATGVLMLLAKQLNLPAPAYVDAQNLVKSMLACCTTCEKLTVTPIPMPYTRHTVRFILLYTACMPIVLWGNLQWGTFLVAPVITFALAGIDTVGIYIENPNTILPMASYCRAMHQDVLLSAHEWAAETGNGTAVHLQGFLSGSPPGWQQESNACVQQQACMGCVDDDDGDWGTVDRRKNL